eukprot:g4589.t1
METSSSAAQPWRKSVHDPDARKREAAKPTPYGMRRSCELCRRRKKKCDGGRPCRRCLGAGSECMYIMRRWHQSPQQQQQQQQRGRSGSVHPSQVVQHSAPEAGYVQGTLSLKRCRLSASPATGLIGMRENGFLNDFFICVGFIPLTTPSYIREAMVKLMATPAILRRGDVSYHGDRARFSNLKVAEEAFRNGLGVMDCSGCIFWCAVALGALVRGSPIESVSGYCRLATDGLNSSSGPVNAERATAWTILGYLYLFCGNTDMFQQYLTLAESFLNQAVEQGSSEALPMGFAETVSHRMTVKICCGEVDADEVESFCARAQAPPELSDAANAFELYTFQMRSFRMFEQAFYETAFCRSETISCGKGFSGVELNNESEQVNPLLIEPSDEVLDVMIMGIKAQQGQFQRLEDASDRPSIRSGVGGLITNVSIFFNKIAKGDLKGSLERISRCVDVFERFPGVCRLWMGTHTAHVMITALAAMDGGKARELYHTLRTSYNSARLPGTVPLPPLEEWQGISRCCEYIYCRTMERALLSKEMGVSPDRINGGIPYDGINGEVNNHSKFGSTNIISEEGNTPTAPCPSSHNGMGLRPPKKYDASPHFYARAGVCGTTPILAPTFPNMNGENQAVSNAEVEGAKRWMSEGTIDASEVVQGPGGLLRGSMEPTSYGMRRSCELCRKRKKKCDGGRPCRRCLGAGTGCVYKMRRWHQSLEQKERQVQQQQHQQRVASGSIHPSQFVQHSASDSGQAQGTLLIKRCRLSASPATGLIGMQENVFLSDFFSCVGFMPFTTPSYIRETMVKLMATAAILQRRGAVSNHGDGVRCSDPATTGDSCSNGSGAMDSSGCIFWCAVALGALARGVPIESVSRYCKLATDGLSSSSRPVNAERAMAWTILGYLYLFCGNTDKFQEYLTLSESFVNQAVERGSSEALPVGFADIVHHRMTVKICCGEVDTDEVESFCAHVQPLPELNDAATESELYAFTMRSFRMFEQAVYGTAYSRTATSCCGEGLNDVELNREDERVNPRLMGPSDEVLDAMVVRIKEQQCQFERLEDAVDRPSIRAGIGGLIINGSLFFDKAAKGDLSGSLERIGRCVEVFERFPGVCRLTMGAHAAHVVITALATIGGCKAQDLYHTLRNSYNSARLPGTVPLPPLDEWQGISPCCEYFYCRTMERLLLSKKIGVSWDSFENDRIESDTKLDGINGEANKSLDEDGHMTGLASTNVVAEAGNTPTAPFPSTRGRTWLHVPSSLKPTSYGMRRSCERCRRHKKKCDGGRPCRRCLRAGNECLYIMRLWHQSTQQHQQQQQLQLQRFPGGSVHPSQGVQHSTPGEGREQGTLSFKRCRLSASPATGLIGMQENVFLSDFFSCIGFMPFTTPSYIRETMVKLMATPSILQRGRAVSYHGVEARYSDTTDTEDAFRSGVGAMDCSGCIFWCAVALGALARGSPIESVSRYCQLAIDGLSSSTGPANAERATAWTILAYLYLFRGNTDKFQEYLTRSESFLNQAVEQGSSEVLPVGFAEIVDYRMTVKVCCGNVDADEVESFCAQVQPPPELRDAATESELYPFVMRSLRMFEQAVYGTADSRNATSGGGEGFNDAAVDLGGEDANVSLMGPSEDVLDDMIMMIKENQSQFERLEDVVDRPSIRFGIGGLIINGSLFFDKAAKGDLDGSLERIGRCIEVFERYPGICRLTMGAHAAHIIFTALAAMDGCKARELYHTLRISYNSARLPGIAPLPPWEEWKGISPCCEYFYCRTMERLLMRKEVGVSSSSIESSIEHDDINGDANKSLDRDGPMRGLGAADIVAEAENTPTAPLTSSNDRPELRVPNRCDVGPQFYAGAAWLEATSSLVPTSPSVHNDETLTVSNGDMCGAERSEKAGTMGAGLAAQAPGACLMGPDNVRWGGTEDGTGNEYRLDAEDWMEAADTLYDAVTHPYLQH